MRKFSLNLDANINGIYLNSETIEMLSIIQCSTIEELQDFVRNCSQLNVGEQEIRNWDINQLENIKRNIVEQYKGTIVPMEQSIKDRRSVLKATLENAGIKQNEIESYISLFEQKGYEGVKQKLIEEHPQSYSDFTEKAHRFISTERDQVKSVTYEELIGINNSLKEHNTILIGAGRYYDVTKKMYDERVPDMEKYDLYYAQRGLDFCYKNNMHARYHTLLDKQTMEEHLKGIEPNDIKAELKSYVKRSVDFISKYNEEHKIDGKGVISSVDLFNEIISFDSPYKNMWQELHGITNEDLADIFKYALDNKPEGVTYVYNEPFLENKERRDVVLKQLEQINLLCPGLIDTIGTQMHIEMTQNIDDIRACFEDLKHSGLNVQITEFDMCLPERIMFDDQGKVRSEKEIVKFINEKTGMTIESIAELKKMRINEISKAIKDTGVSLEGVTYWSISDTLDHNLERTNRKTLEKELPRDIAETRYAGLYSELDREKEISTQDFTKSGLEVNVSKSKKNKLFSLISKITNKIKDVFKRKNIKMLPDGNKIIEEDTIDNCVQKNSFLESLRVSPEELTKNAIEQKNEKVQIKQQDKKDGPSLDD